MKDIDTLLASTQKYTSSVVKTSLSFQDRTGHHPEWDGASLKYCCCGWPDDRGLGRREGYMFCWPDGECELCEENGLFDNDGGAERGTSEDMYWDDCV